MWKVLRLRASPALRPNSGTVKFFWQKTIIFLPVLLSAVGVRHLVLQLLNDIRGAKIKFILRVKRRKYQRNYIFVISRDMKYLILNETTHGAPVRRPLNTESLSDPAPCPNGRNLCFIDARAVAISQAHSENKFELFTRLH